MNTTIILQDVCQEKETPTLTQFQTWVDHTRREITPQNNTEKTLTLRIIDKQESAALNETYRHKKGPTNVLSFPDDPIPAFTSDSLGDLAICAPLVTEEATEQEIHIEAHWAHLVIHGTLHLMGYDHIASEEARIMESLETKIMQALGYPAPY